MTKDEALDLALEALEQIASAMPFPVGRKAIAAIKQARALDKKAENARELGLDYEPVREDWGPGPHEVHSLPPAAPVQDNDAHYKGVVEGVQKLFDDKRAQPAPAPKGWKMVPVEPTREMWTAVNKLDDQCAAGNYDGKGCSIEQAWNCLLDAAPTPPEAQPAHTQDIPDLIAGALGVSRGTAYDMMREALKEASPVQEPDHGDELTIAYMSGVHRGKELAAQRQWVGLTDEERNKLWRDVVKWGDPSHDDVDLIKAIEAKLKELNT
jgi:hypothetical protein